MLSFITIILLILIIIGLKAALNFYRLKKLLKFQDIYKGYTTEKYEGEEGWLFYEKKQEIKELFEKAGIKSGQLPIMQPVGYGYVQSLNIDIVENMANTQYPAIIGHMIGCFKQAIGVYKRRLKDSINPFYWLELIIYLPQKTIEYIGFSQDSKSATAVSKTINVIYWLVSGLVTLFTTNSYFHNLVVQIFK
jgi:hypothetical protein